MASITTVDYFKKQPVLIDQPSANNGIPSDVYSARTEALQNAIDVYEKQYLETLLGVGLAAEFVAGISDSKWATLKGLLWDSTNKVSLVAYYIYFYYLSDYSASYDGQLFKQNKVENTINISVAPKQVYVWAEMKKKQVAVMDYLTATTLDSTATLDKTLWDELKINYNTAGL